MTLTERTSAALAKLRASDTPKDKALIVAIENLSALACLHPEARTGCNDLLAAILSSLEDSL